MILGHGPAARFAQVIVPILYLAEFQCCFEGFAHPDLVSELVRDVGTRGDQTACCSRMFAWC